MKFAYTAQGKTGERKTGIIDAPDRFAAARTVRSQGDFPITIESVDRTKSFGTSFTSLFGRVALHELIIFTRNLSGMLTAGLSLNRALDVLRKQSSNQRLKTVLETLSKKIDAGETLSAGMELFPRVFSPIFVSMVRAGEESGNLSGALTNIGAQLDKAYSLNKKIKGAMMYPAVIISAIILIGILMFMFVVPTLTKTFTEMGVELPASTKFVIFISDTLSNHALLFFVGLFGVGV
ncbi:MAG TPA: type II secretion system F family protein, partial [Blastocatellia bacterium]|nr:type II secretion system F family protein [Blastocatellia bacterium]